MKLLTRHASFILYALMMLVIAVLDLWAGTQVNLWVLYFIFIGLASWNLGQRAGVTTTVLAVVLLAGTAAIGGHGYSSLGYLAFAIGSKTIAYFVLVGLLGALRSQEVDRIYQPPKSRG